MLKALLRPCGSVTCNSGPTLFTTWIKAYLEEKNWSYIFHTLQTYIKVFWYESNCLPLQYKLWFSP